MGCSDIVLTARKWGNSLGVSLPAEVVAKERLRPNDKVVVCIKKAARLQDLFGTLKLKKSSQRVKDEMRSGWGD